MSAEKGGALVRSPPSIYSHQAVGWGGQNSTLSNSHPHRQPIRATVTKISSGDSTRVNKYDFTSVDKKMKIKEWGENCACGGWSKAIQLGHDLIQLKYHHESILKGLFEEVDELKRKNSDLIQSLLLGPISTNFSDLTISNNVPVMENKSRATSTTDIDMDALKDLTIAESLTGKLPVLLKKTSIGALSKSCDQISTNVGNSHSSAMELVEDDTKEAKRQLREERRKNEYLWRVVEELKRQVSEATNGKKEENIKNFRNVSLNQHEWGNSVPNAPSINQLSKPLYLPAIVSKHDDKEKAEKQIPRSMSFFKNASSSNDELNGSIFKNSCPTLPSINSSRDSFKQYQEKNYQLENQTEIDCYSLRNKNTQYDRHDRSNKMNSLPITNKKSSKKERNILNIKQDVSERLSSQKAKKSTRKANTMEAIHNNFLEDAGKETLKTNLKRTDLLNDSPEMDSSRDDVEIVECVALGNTICIKDIPNKSLSSNEQSSVRPRTKGRKSGRNKKRKNELARNDTEAENILNKF